MQKQIARVLGLPMHAVEVDVRRLGGAFGGKEDQATPWAVMCALGCVVTGKPVRLTLDRHDDLRMTGKRHPYSSDYRIGVDAEGRILAYEVTFYQNSGSAADLSTSILERSLFHATGSYAIPNVRATGLACRTNLPPFTAFRGFGGPQAMFVLEAAIAAAARRLGVPAREVQRRNLLREGTVFPYGMVAEDCRAQRCWDEADRRYDFAALAAAAAAHNAAHAATKKGVAVMPVCFGISFTNTALNQARALVHVYQDGSVNVSTGAVEMGQGVNLKLRKIVAETLGIGLARVRVESTSTGRVANTSPTAASTGADMNGAAARLACLQILRRLRPIAAAKLGDGHLRRRKCGPGLDAAGAGRLPRAGRPLGARALRDARPRVRPRAGEGSSLRLPRLRHRGHRGHPRLPARHRDRRRRAPGPRRSAAASTSPPTSARSRAPSRRASAGCCWKKRATTTSAASCTTPPASTRCPTCASRRRRWTSRSWRTRTTRAPCSAPRPSASRRSCTASAPTSRCARRSWPPGRTSTPTWWRR